MSTQAEQARGAAVIHSATERALEAAREAVFVAESRAFAAALRTPDHVAVACPVAPWDCAACQADETLSRAREAADAADRLELRAALRLAVCDGRAGVPLQRGPIPCGCEGAQDECIACAEEQAYADHEECVDAAMARVGAQLVAMCSGGAA